MPDDRVELAVRESFARQSFLSAIGAKLTRVASGEIDIELPRSGHIGQQSGAVHAGVIAAIADTACGYAALTRMPAGSDVVSVEFKLNLLAPAHGSTLIARGRVIRSGRTLTVCSADVFADDTHVATMIGTFFAIRPDMAGNPRKQDGPTRERKDEPTVERSTRSAKSRDALKEGSVHGERPGTGRSLGTSRHR